MYSRPAMESPVMVMTPHIPEVLKRGKRITPPLFMKPQRIYRAPDRISRPDFSQEEE